MYEPFNPKEIKTFEMVFVDELVCIFQIIYCTLFVSLFVELFVSLFVEPNSELFSIKLLFVFVVSLDIKKLQIFYLTKVEKKG